MNDGVRCSLVNESHGFALIGRYWKRGQLSFALPRRAFTFPTGAFTIASFKLSGVLPLPGIFGFGLAAFGVLAMVVRERAHRRFALWIFAQMRSREAAAWRRIAPSAPPVTRGF
jgi:tellurite resistance protein TehA-like permease